jgi:hypothetical protein
MGTTPIANGSDGNIIYNSGNTVSEISTGDRVVTALGVNTNTAGGIVVAPSVLTSNAIVLGGGDGTGPKTTTTGTGVVTALGNNVNAVGGVITVGTTLNDYAILLGRGAGTAIGILSSLGTSTTVLHGNAGGDPTWGSVVLTSDVSGILPVANGGTNKSSYTAGSVVFAGASGTSLTEDNTNFFWDDTNNRLGIGTATPSTPLYVLSGNAVISGIDTITNAVGTFVGPTRNFNTTGNPALFQLIANTLTGTDLGPTLGFAGMKEGGTSIVQLSIIKAAFENNTTGDLASYLAFGTRINSSNVLERMRINSVGNVGIANTNPGALLSLGTAGSKAGTLSLAGGTSGVVTIQTAAAAGTWSLTLPANDGNNLQVLMTDGSGITTWSDSVTSVGLVSTTGTAQVLTVTVDTTNPITTQGTFTLNVTGNKGGINYFDTTSSWKSSTASQLVYDDTNYRLGIGTATPSTKLYVLSGTDVTSGTDTITNAVGTFVGPTRNFNTTGNPALFQLIANTLTGTDLGPTLGFAGIKGGSSIGQLAIVKAAFENNTTGDLASYLAFGTRIDSSNVLERMRINSVGNVGIANTNPSALLSLGTAGSKAGTLSLAGSTAGTLTISVPSTITSWTMQLPPAVPTKDAYRQGLLADTDGTTAWKDVVTLLTWTGGLVTITDPSTLPKFTIAGNKGGITYFDSTTSWKSSTASQLVYDDTNYRLGIGNAAPSALLSLGTAGTLGGAFTMAGSSAGTVTVNAPATITDWSLTLPATKPTVNRQLFVGDTNGAAQWTPAASYSLGAITLGVVGTQGSLKIAGTTAGTVTVTTPATITDWSLTLPPTKPTISSQLFVGDTSGNATWTAAASYTAGTIILGVVGTQGNLKIAGTTAGTLTITTPATVNDWTLTLPADKPTVNRQLFVADTNGAALWTPAASYASGAITVGVVGTQGSLKIAGTTSGTVTITTLPAAGTYTLTLPPTDGDNLQTMLSDGSGVLFWHDIITSVGLNPSTGTAGIMTVSVDTTNPITTHGVFTLNVAGNKGGITYFDSISSWKTSTASQLVYDDTNYRLGIGNATPGALLSLGTAGTKAGTLSMAGSSAGTVTVTTPATITDWTLTLPPTKPTIANQLFVGDTSGNATWTAAASYTAGTIILGVVGTQGSLKIAGTTAGTVTVTTPATVTDYTITLPAAKPTIDRQLFVADTNGAALWTPAASYASGAITLGVVGTQGSLKIAGTTAGTVTVTTPATVTDWTLTLPAAKPTIDRQLFVADTNGTTIWTPAASYASGAITLGVVGTQGSLKLSGTTSGTVTLTTAAAAGTYTLTLPTTDGDNLQTMLTDGSGVLSWHDIITSVGLVSTTGTAGIMTVSVDTTNPITTQGTFTLNVAGNKGGITYFDSISSWKTSTASQLVYDDTNYRLGIANAAPSALLSLGTAGTKAGTLSMAGSSAGTVTVTTPATITDWTLTLPATKPTIANQLFVADTNGTAIWTPAASYTAGTIILGVVGTQGNLKLAGTTAGTVTVTAPATITDWMLTLPATKPTIANQLFVADTNGTAIWTAAASYTAGTIILGVVGTQGNLKLAGTTAGTLTVTAPATITDWMLTLPATKPTVANQLLVADTSGNSIWTPAASYATGALKLGVVGTQGSLVLAGTTAGTVTVTVPVNISAPWTLTLPVAKPARVNQVIIGDTNGVTSWADVVTSVGLQPTTGTSHIMTVTVDTANPITTTGTFTLNVAGTSGGIPYFDAANSWNTSALLATASVVLGGGAGSAPYSTTTGTGVVTAIGQNVTGTSGGIVIANNPTMTLPNINNVRLGYTSTVTSSTPVVLTKDSNYSQIFTGSTAQTITLPNVTTLVLGQAYYIMNNSSAILTVQSSGSNTVATVIPGTTVYVICIAVTGTGAGSWDYDYTGFAAITGTGNNVLSANPTINGTSTSITNVGTFALRDTSAAYDLTIAAVSSTALTAGRTLTVDIVNSNRTLKIGGNVTFGDTFSTVGTFSTAGTFSVSGAYSTALTITTATALTLPSTGYLLASANPLYGSTGSGIKTITGTPDSTSFLRGDGVWQVVALPNVGTAGQLAYYSSSTAIDSTPTIAYTSGKLAIGIAGTTMGQVSLAGSTSGTVTIDVAATAGTWAFTLPTSGGTANYFMRTDGSGNASWTSLTVDDTATNSTHYPVMVDAAGGTVAKTSSTNFQINPSTGAALIKGNIYTQGRVGMNDTSNVSKVYQYYNSTTDSLDTVFG